MSDHFNRTSERDERLAPSQGGGGTTSSPHTHEACAAEREVEVVLLGQRMKLKATDNAEQLEKVAAFVSRKLDEVSAGGKVAVSGTKLALLTALNIASDYFSVLDDTREFRHQVAARSVRILQQLEDAVAAPDLGTYRPPNALVDVLAHARPQELDDGLGAASSCHADEQLTARKQVSAEQVSVTAEQVCNDEGADIACRAVEKQAAP